MKNGRPEGPLAKYAGKTVLAIGAHPDDLELGIGGTLACLSEAGARVISAVVCIPNQLELRREETRRAAEILGCEVRFLISDRTSRVEDLKNYQLVGMIDDLILENAPAAVFCHSASNFHTDHKLVHDACIASQRITYFDHFCYPPITCHASVSVIFTPQAFVDISDQIEKKMAAIMAHYSQFGQRHLRAEHCRVIDRRNGQLIGVAYAEGLEIRRLWMNLEECAERRGREALPSAHQKEGERLC